MAATVPSASATCSVGICSTHAPAPSPSAGVLGREHGREGAEHERHLLHQDPQCPRRGAIPERGILGMEHTRERAECELHLLRRDLQRARARWGP